MAEEKSSLLADRIGSGELLQQQSRGQIQDSWTKANYVILLVCLLVCFGDGVELYLPGKYCGPLFYILHKQKCKKLTILFIFTMVAKLAKKVEIDL